MTGIVFDIKEFSVFDGPGIRTTVFLKGCPLRCRWCHNPEGLRPERQLMVSSACCIHCGACKKVCPSPGECTSCGKCVPYCKGGFRKIIGSVWESEVLADRLQKDADIYQFSGGGITFSGGEPLMQWNFVSDTIARLKDVHTAIETSGYASDAIFADAMEKLDLILMDWKVSNPEKHLFYTGVQQDTILRHLQMLSQGNTPFILRMPLIPGVNDEPEHFRTAASLVRKAKKLIRVDLLPYQKTAGAKYEMVSMTYQPDFPQEDPLRLYSEIFEENGIPYQLFR